MQNRRWIALFAGLLLAGTLLGCAGSSAPPKASTSATTPASAPASSEPAMMSSQSAPRDDSTASEMGPASSSPVMNQPTNAAAPGAMAQPGLPPPSAAAKIAGQSERKTARNERPGLATQFGEDLRRDAQLTSFERESMTSPLFTTTIWYNDAAGADALAQQAVSRSGNRAEVNLLNGGVTVQVTDSWFEVLPGFAADGRTYAIGEAGARYAIRIVNRTDFPFEVVSSVDGLDVISGSPAAFERRGYILAARDTMTIEGYRTSESSVAAFRFGKVGQSYSVQMGHGERNIGVIGVAFFQQHGQRPVYPNDDTRLRQDANPFPGQYAPRPQAR